MSVPASVNMILLWDAAINLSDIDQFMRVERDVGRAEALLRGTSTPANVWNEIDPALAIIQDHLNSNKASIRDGISAGLDLSYDRTQKATVNDLLLPILTDNMFFDTVALTALIPGRCFVGTLDSDVSTPLLEGFSERKNTVDVAQGAFVANFAAASFGFVVSWKARDCRGYKRDHRCNGRKEFSLAELDP
ncbi:26S proteasome regulatory complex non-ATPase subcomplex Rpn1 subunit [Gracilaria domingensis]|nr:26S proteasome regulatory complex non-ATPase subcomplex Rpn1 subunit [Gracilaria domingensis]